MKAVRNRLTSASCMVRHDLNSLGGIALMIKKLTLLLLSYGFFAGCSSLPTPEYATVIYDYQIKPPYEMNSSYKHLNVSLDAADVTAPEKTLADESLKFGWSSLAAKAQIAVYIHLSNSFLIDRENTIKAEVVYAENGQGSFIRTPIQRGFIRTRYTIEVIDRVKDTLIEHVNSAGQYPIEAELTNSKQDNKKILTAAYHKNLSGARNKLVADIWSDLKKRHLSQLQTTFGKIEGKVVSGLSVEPKFKQAYLLLNSNRKRDAVKALNIYNLGMAAYKDKEDDLSLMILKYLNHCITVSSSIANHEYPDRY
jgi:hypothetical protein